MPFAWSDVLGAVLAGAALLVPIYYVMRHGGGRAMEELERANRILENRIGELERQNAAQAHELELLRRRTDVALAIAPVLEALKLHEERAALRSERTLDVLNMMAARLGPEPSE